MALYNKLSDLIGNTPLLSLKSYAKQMGLNTAIMGKLECFNPAGSVKDRTAKALIDDAVEKGLIKPGSTIIEPTSGNTGIGLAFYAVCLGYRVVLTMPDTMSKERRNILKAYGAELVLTDGKLGMKGAIEKAIELNENIPDSFIPYQFSNPSNPKVHKNTTGPEIWADTKGNIDIFISGIGTGGTITGAGEYLKEKNPSIKIVAVEPYLSPVLSKGCAGPHGIQGIGAGFVPEILNTGVYDEIIQVKDEDAYKTCKTLVKTEGLLVGISSGAAIWAATLLSQKKENQNKSIVAILPDSGERYLSSPMFLD